MLGLQYELDVARTFVVVTVHDFLADIRGHGGLGGMFKVDYIHHHGVVPEELTDGLLHVAHFQTGTADGVAVEPQLIVVTGRDEFRGGGEFLGKCLVGLLGGLTVVEASGGNLMGQVLLDAVGGTVVGTKECEPLALSDGTVQIVEEIGQLLVD